MICISEFEDQNIISFRLVKEVNAHSICTFDVIIGNTDHSRFIDLVDKSISINNGRDYLFFGFIRSITAEIMHSKTILHVCASSHSARIDNEPKNRVYQDPNKKLSDILKYVKNEAHIQISCKDDSVLLEPIVQSNETDFNFLLRMAAYTKQQLIINDSESPDTIILKITDSYDNNTASIDCIPDKLSIQNIIPEHTTSKQTIAEFVLHDQYFEIGKRINLKQACLTGYISKCEIILERNVIQYKYTSYELGQMPSSPELKVLPYIEMEAVVEDSQNPDGKCFIKAKVTGDYIDAMPDNLMWMPYQVPYLSDQAGAVFLPNTNDHVTLIFSENKLTAKACCDEYTLNNDFREKQNHYISSIFGKQLVFHENSIEIHADKSRIVISDDDISLLVGENSINISESAINLKIKGTQIQIDRDFALQTDSFSIQGSDATIKTSGDVKIRGSKIFLK
ncbi:hypothetical protein [Ruminococcus flavefaciens]|uniref:hypothetical protein n=1 Tax=Ruminococcus flavefaciens TaxID=1265 RepID=UPI0004909AD7|nr:hypothetical protein [Ruminococcus flavefaciens]